jgi:hypothetical protein
VPIVLSGFDRFGTTCTSTLQPNALAQCLVLDYSYLLSIAGLPNPLLYVYNIYKFYARIVRGMVSRGSKNRSRKQVELDNAALSKQPVPSLKWSSWYSLRRSIVLMASLGIQVVCFLPISQYNPQHENECENLECSGRIAWALRITVNSEARPIAAPSRLGFLFNAETHPKFQVSYLLPPDSWSLLTLNLRFILPLPLSRSQAH